MQDDSQNDAVNDAPEDDDEEPDMAGLFIASLIAAAMGNAQMLAIREPQPVENGVARFVRSLDDDEFSDYHIYEVEPPFGKHTHVIAIACENGCCGSIVPVHEDPEWQGGYRPCGGNEGFEIYQQMTDTSGGIVACFARFGYTIAQQA